MGGLFGGLFDMVDNGVNQAAGVVNNGVNQAAGVANHTVNQAAGVANNGVNQAAGVANNGIGKIAEQIEGFRRVIIPSLLIICLTTIIVVFIIYSSNFQVDFSTKQYENKNTRAKQFLVNKLKGKKTTALQSKIIEKALFQIESLFQNYSNKNRSISLSQTLSYKKYKIYFDLEVDCKTNPCSYFYQIYGQIDGKLLHEVKSRKKIYETTMQFLLGILGSIQMKMWSLSTYLVMISSFCVPLIIDFYDKRDYPISPLILSSVYIMVLFVCNMFMAEMGHQLWSFSTYFILISACFLILHLDYSFQRQNYLNNWAITQLFCLPILLALNILIQTIGEENLWPLAAYIIAFPIYLLPQMVMGFTKFKKNILDFENIVIGLIISVLPVLITNFFFVVIENNDFSKFYNLLPFAGVIIFFIIFWSLEYVYNLIESFRLFLSFLASVSFILNIRSILLGQQISVVICFYILSGAVSTAIYLFNKYKIVYLHYEGQRHMKYIRLMLFFIPAVFIGVFFLKSNSAQSEMSLI